MSPPPYYAVNYDLWMSPGNFYVYFELLCLRTYVSLNILIWDVLLSIKTISIEWRKMVPNSTAKLSTCFVFMFSLTIHTKNSMWRPFSKSLLHPGLNPDSITWIFNRFSLTILTITKSTIARESDSMK